MTLFSIQRDLEDLFTRRQLVDNDQYAIRLAAATNNANSSSEGALCRAFSKIRTNFFTANRSLNRREFEAELAARIDKRFHATAELEIFPEGLDTERKRLEKTKRITLARLLDEFKHSIESKSIPHFWESRSKGNLRKKPESIAELAITQFLSAVVAITRRGFFIRQLASGVGFLDIAIVLSSVPHLVELKILTSHFTGAEQLEKYMIAERRRRGWLVVFDARKPDDKTDIPPRIVKPSGTINVLVVDINPITPSSLSK